LECIDHVNACNNSFVHSITVVALHQEMSPTCLGGTPTNSNKPIGGERTNATYF